MITKFKIYESVMNFKSYKKGDYIVLISLNEYAKERDFIAGEVYKIDSRDNFSEEFRLHNINNGRFVWVKAHEIRKANAYEIESKKYNL